MIFFFLANRQEINFKDSIFRVCSARLKFGNMEFILFVYQKKLSHKEYYFYSHDRIETNTFSFGLTVRSFITFVMERAKTNL